MREGLDELFHWLVQERGWEGAIYECWCLSYMDSSVGADLCLLCIK